LGPPAGTVQSRPLRTVGIVGVLAALVALPLAVPPTSATSPPAWSAFLPDGGENLPGGSSYDIQWQATHDADTALFVTLSLVPGGFATAGEFPTGSASWTWRVPTANLSAARMRACAVAYDGSRGCRESSADFTVSMTPPYIGLLSPSDGGENVSPGAPIVLVFDPPPDPTNVTWTISPAMPWAATWSSGNTMLTLVHPTPFAECVAYTMMISDGSRALSFTFSTLCPAPRVLDYGFDPSLNGSIWMSFNKPMDRLETYATIIPSIPLAPAWSADNTYLVLRPVPSFSPCTEYAVTLRGGKDMFGNHGLILPGPLPNPFSFTATCNPPYVVSTSPSNGTAGVPIGESVVVTFSEPMDASTLAWSIRPAIAAQVRFQGSVLTIEPLTPYSPCTEYVLEILSAMDLDGLALVPGPAPNPWSFTVACPPPPPRGLGIAALEPDLVRITWEAVPGAELYRVYESSDRFALSPWALLGGTPSPSFEVSHLRDGQVHFYLVRAVAGGVEGPNSTMATKAEISLSFSPSATSVAWVSLPYNSTFGRGSDISTELTEARTDLVARWDPSNHTTVLWYRFRGQWRGADFAIRPGDGILLGSIATFSWPVVGTDAPVTLSFHPHPGPMGDVAWLSLPWTSTYRTARDVVVDVEGSDGPNANTRIVEVGKWDHASQRAVIYRWTSSGWAGLDFMINPGDGVYFRVASAFNWEPLLLQPSIP